MLGERTIDRIIYWGWLLFSFLAKSSQILSSWFLPTWSNLQFWKTLKYPHYFIFLVLFGLYLLSVSRHWQHLYGQRDQNLSNGIFPVYISYFSRLSLAYSSLEMSLLQKSFSWSLTSKFIPVQGSSDYLFWNLVKSFTSVLAIVLGSLCTSLTSSLSRVFEIFHFLPLPILFCNVWLSLNYMIILLTLLFDTWKRFDNFVYHFTALWASAILFLKSNFFCFWCIAFINDRSDP